MDIQDDVVSNDEAFATIAVGQGFVFAGEVYQKIDGSNAIAFPSLASTGFTSQIVSKRKLVLHVELPE